MCLRMNLFTVRSLLPTLRRDNGMDCIVRNLTVGEASPLDSAPAYPLSERAVCPARETVVTKELRRDGGRDEDTCRAHAE